MTIAGPFLHLRRESFFISTIVLDIWISGISPLKHVVGTH